jgi:signal transduction histidine kinase
LAIARGFAQAHGGDLTCEEPHGIGAMFRLVLPLEPRQTESARQLPLRLT